METVLKRARRKKGLSLRKAAREIGIAHSRIHRHENRQEVMYTGDERRYAEFYEIPPEEIRDDQGFAAVVPEVVEFIDGCNGDQKAKV